MIKMVQNILTPQKLEFSTLWYITFRIKGNFACCIKPTTQNLIRNSPIGSKSCNLGSSGGGLYHNGELLSSECPWLSFLLSLPDHMDVRTSPKIFKNFFCRIFLILMLISQCRWYWGTWNGLFTLSQLMNAWSCITESDTQYISVAAKFELC